MILQQYGKAVPLEPVPHQYGEPEPVLKHHASHYPVQCDHHPGAPGAHHHEAPGAQHPGAGHLPAVPPPFESEEEKKQFFSNR